MVTKGSFLYEFGAVMPDSSVDPGYYCTPVGIY